MAMKCIEEQFQFTLSHSYSIAKFRVKGSIQRMKQNLMGIQADPTDLREKMRKGKLMTVNGNYNWFKIILHPVYILQTKNLDLKRLES